MSMPKTVHQIYSSQNFAGKHNTGMNILGPYICIIKNCVAKLGELATFGWQFLAGTHVFSGGSSVVLILGTKWFTVLKNAGKDEESIGKELDCNQFRKLASGFWVAHEHRRFNNSDIWFLIVENQESTG